MAAHGHAKGVKLIADIMAGAALENGTAYDTLRLPLYKTWEEHATNYAAIRAELNPAAVRRRAACTCPGRAEVMALLTAAWENVSDAQAKAAYDELVPARAVIPKALPIFVPPPIENEPTLNLNPGSNWNADFNNVEGCPRTLAWSKVPLPIFCCDVNNTFWTSLSIGLYSNYEFWSRTKCEVDLYYTAVMVDEQHPRYAGYTILSAYAEAVGLGSLASQLSPNPTTVVSPEMWQVVADCFHIELLVITGDKRVINGRPSYPMVSSGEHNARQIFLRLETDDEYHFVRPDKPNPYEWRYSSHIIRDLVSAPKNPEQLQEFNVEASELSSRRCPYLVTDLDGVNVVPYAAIPGYGGPFLPPNHVLDECEIVAAPADEQVNAYLNNGLWL